MSFCIFSILTFCHGQDSVKRPKLGLALSGGGACGLAHIGVLMVMDEEGLRPDFISGVSMGSIVGSLYSAGYSADSLAKICRSVDWNLILSNKIPEDKIIFGEKDHFYNSIVTLPVTTKKVKLPSGLINGQQLENTLSYYYWPVAETENFSMLPIPFMCLAVDLITCSKVELNSGYLPDAIRASSAVPYIFTPLKTDSLLLVDGGVLRNIAVEELREMGADIVIGSYTGSRYRNENELQSIGEVMIQLGFFSSINDYKQQKKLIDFLIEPYTNDISPTSFGSFDTLIMRGYKAASQFRNIFRMLADSLDLKSQPAPPRPIEEEKDYIFDTIVVTGNNFFSDDQIRGVLGISPGDRVNRDMLSEKIELLYGKAWLEKVKYRIVPDKENLILEIDCIEKPRALFYGSVHYDNAVNSGLILGLTVRDPLIRSSQIDLKLFAGKSPRTSFSFIKFIDKNQKYSLSADLKYDDTFVPKMELDGESEDADSRNLLYGLSLSRRLGLNNLIKFSGRLENKNIIRDEITGSGKEKYKFIYASGELGYNNNTLNSKYFPDRGIKSDLSLVVSRLISASYNADSTVVLHNTGESIQQKAELFYTIRGSINQYFTKNKKWTLCLGADILFISDSDSVSSMNNNYYLGGIDQVSSRTIPAIGFHPLQLQTSRMAGFHIDIDYEIFEKFHLTLMSGMTIISEPSENRSLSFLPGIGLGAGYMSIIGPIKAGLMYGYYKNEEYFNQLKGFISVGYNF